MTTVLQPQEELAREFPVGFRFGVAMAAYQIEGAVAEDGRGESIWDRVCHIPGAIAGGEAPHQPPLREEEGDQYGQR